MRVFFSSQPVEMNASDDRSVEAFKKQLESATQMRSVVATDQRPNCLVIDEIDGAPAPTIAYLISVLTEKAGGKKGKKKGMQVLRPIICICNDLYTPALR
jgi:chromosome transmission fidelity protein 18